MTPTIPSKSLVSLWEDGIRPITNQYQYVALYLMLDFANRHSQKLATEFTSFSGEFAAYQVPPDLVALRDNFLAQAQSKEGAGRGAGGRGWRTQTRRPVFLPRVGRPRKPAQSRTLCCPARRRRVGVAAREHARGAGAVACSWCATCICTVQLMKSASACEGATPVATFPTGVLSRASRVGSPFFVFCMFTIASLFRCWQLTVLTALLGPVVTACGQRTKSPSASPMPTAAAAPGSAAPATDLFVLAAAPCTADGYFVTIHSGEFVRPDGRTFPVPSGHLLEGSWGASGTLWGVGDARQPAPTHLRMRWFSYVEDKFYEGDFALPQAKIYALLQQGYWDVEQQRPGTYNMLIVCTIPKGGVVLWLGGTNQTLIGRFQGHPATVDFEQVYGSINRAKLLQEVRAQMPPEAASKAVAGSTDASIWDQYLRRYPWKIEISQPLTLYKYSISYLSAERVRDPLSRDLEPYRQQLLAASAKPVPRKLYLYGQAEHGGRYQIRLNPMDEAETMAAFHALSQASPQSPITLFVEVSKDFKRGTLTLRNERQQIPLTKTKVEVLSQD